MKSQSFTNYEGDVSFKKVVDTFFEIGETRIVFTNRYRFGHDQGFKDCRKQFREEMKKRNLIEGTDYEFQNRKGAYVRVIAKKIETK